MTHAKTLHRCAAQIAGRLKNDQPPSLDERMMTYLDHHPEQLMDSLRGMVEQLQADTAEDTRLIDAYLFLMGVQLELLRYQLDRHYDWARDQVAQFQQRVVELAREGQLPEAALAQIAFILREAKLEADPELFAALADVVQSRDLPAPESMDVNELLAGLVEEREGNEFEAVRMITEVTYAMPAPARVLLATAMSRCDRPVLRNAVPLLVLDDQPEVRRGVAEGMLKAVKGLPPQGLRRLIALRSWLPEDDRPAIDRVVKAARRHGIECASWPLGENVEIHASAVDGSGAQGFLIISKVGRKCRLSSVLLRLRTGILDAWVSPEWQSKREMPQQLSAMAGHAPLRIASRGYLDRAVRHHLALSVRNAAVPPAGLLEVAEVLGATGWQPEPLDSEATIHTLYQALPEAVREPEVIARCLGESDRWGVTSGITDSWFEDDQEVANRLAGSRARRLETLAQQVLIEVIEPRRTKWLEQLLWAALWFKDVAEADDHSWAGFLLVAWALLQGHPIREIPLFKEIAVRTVLALRA